MASGCFNIGLITCSAILTSVPRIIFYNKQRRDDLSNNIAQGLSFLLEHCQGLVKSLFTDLKYSQIEN